MPKVLVFSDLQAHNHSLYSRKVKDGINSRLKVALDVMDHLKGYALQEGIQDVLFCGDLYEKKNRTPVAVLNAVQEKFREWSDVGFKVVAIPGNHDHAVLNGSVHALAGLEHIQGVQVVSGVERIEHTLVDGSLVEIVCLPYRKSFGATPVLSVLQEKGQNVDHRIIVGHANIEGFCPMPEKLPEDPIAPHKDWIRTSWLEGFDYAFVGHIHQPGIKSFSFESGKCLAVSPGCPWQENAGARGEDRGFYVWDTDTGLCHFEVIDHLTAFYEIDLIEGEEDFLPEEVENNIFLLFPEHSHIPQTRITEYAKRLYREGAEYVDVRPARVQFERKREEMVDEVSISDGAVEVLSYLLEKEIVDSGTFKSGELLKAAEKLVSDVEHLDKKTGDMVQLLRIESKDLMAFEHLELEFEDRGLVGVRGENRDSPFFEQNGAGKSTLADIISYALYGKPSRNIGLDDVIRRNRKGGRVLFRFRGAKGKEYEVFRTRKDPEFGSVLYFHEAIPENTVNDFSLPEEGTFVDLRGEDKKTTQMNIEKTLGLSHRMFKSIVLLQGNGNFRFSRLKDSEKKDLLGEILGIDYYDDLVKKARSLGKECKKEKEKKETEFLVLEQELETTEGNIRNLRESIKNTKQEHQSKIESLKMEIEQENGRLDLLKKQIPEVPDSLRAELKMAVEEKEAKGKEIIFLQQARTDKLDLYREKQDYFSGKSQEISEKLSERRIKRNSLENRRCDLLVRIEAKEGLIEQGQCTECGQAIPDDYASKELVGDKEEIARIDEQLKKAKEEERESVLELNHLHSEKEEVLDRLVREGKAIASELDARGEEEKEFRREQKRIEKQIEGIELQIQNFDVRVAGQEAGIASLSKKLEEFREETPEAALEKFLSDQQNHLYNQEKMIGEKKAAIKEFEREAKKMEILSSAFGKKGAKSFLFETIMPQLNEKLAHYSELVCGNEFQVFVDTQTETKGGKVNESISLNVRMGNGDSVAFASLSEGEQKRLDIPLLIALHEVAGQYGMGVGFCFLDETIENVDDIGGERILNLLEEVSRNSCTGTFFVVTHKQELCGQFPARILVCKKDKVSFLEQEE